MKKQVTTSPSGRAAARFSTFRRPGLGLVAAVLAGLLAGPASAQLGGFAANECYSLQALPAATTTLLGERVDFDLAIQRKPNCQNVYVDQWSYAAVTDSLEIIRDPAPGREVGVRPTAGAPVDSAFIAQAELWSALTFEYVTTVSQRINVTVTDGVVLPDLAAAEVDVPPFVVAGQAFPVTATITNLGPGPSTAHVLGTLQVDPDVDLSALCPPLQPGASCARSFTVQIDDPGRSTYSFCADAADAIAETSSTNNCAEGIIDVGPATAVDLLADALVISPESPPVGQPTLITAVARNIGGLTSNSFTVRLETPDGVFSAGCPGLAALEMCSRSFSWTPTQAGSNTVTQRIIYSGDERSFANNRLSRTVDVVDGAALPDFAVVPSDIIMWPASPKVGDVVYVVWGVTNLGTRQPSSPLPVASTIDLNGENWGSFACYGIFEQFDRCQTSATFSIRNAGLNIFTVEADFKDSFSESNEDNNTRQLRFFVEDNQSAVSCQGQWTLTGTGGTTFTSTGPGSVVDDCNVYFGQNVSTGCWQTVGDGDLEATWHRPPGAQCPTSVTVTEPEAPHRTWVFGVSIH